ncbi:MAG: hypothetical protein ABIG20_01940 [archaeon]
MKPTYKLSVILILVLFMSGCISGAEQCPLEVSQKEGISILSVTPSYDLIPVGNEIQLRVDLQNRGNAEATNIKARLWAHGGFKVGEETQSVSKMTPPDLTICTAGDTASLVWDLRANCDPTSSTLAVVVDYDYTSEGWAKLLLVSEDEVMRNQGLFKEEGENHPSAGPVQVRIEALQTEPVVIAGTKIGRTFDIRVMFENLGDGQVGEEGMGKIESIDLLVQGPCIFVDSDTMEEIGNKITEEQLGNISLSAGSKSALKIASLKYTGNVPSMIKDFCTINADVAYHYKEYDSTSAKMGVTGTAEQIERCRILFGAVDPSDDYEEEGGADEDIHESCRDIAWTQLNSYGQPKHRDGERKADKTCLIKSFDSTDDASINRCDERCKAENQIATHLLSGSCICEDSGESLKDKIAVCKANPPEGKIYSRYDDSSGCIFKFA